MKIIDGKNAILGRLASYAAKEALQGEEIVILNCEQVIITGNKKNIKENFDAKRRRVGSSQKGPKWPRKSDMMLKRVIRGMLPNYREGRGRDAYKRIKCYIGIPREFENAKTIKSGKEKTSKFIYLSEISK